MSLTKTANALGVLAERRSPCCLYDALDMPDRFQLAKCLAFAMIFAALLNGAGTYFKRIGLLDKDAYRGYWTLHCAGRIDPGRPPPEPHCERYTTAEQIQRQKPPRSAAEVESSYQYIYETGFAGRWFKLAKDLWWLLAIVSCMVWARHVSWEWRWRAAAPVWMFVAYCALALGVTLSGDEPLLSLPGLRSLSFVALALIGAALSMHLRVFAIAIALFLGVQAAIAPLELMRGIHLFHEWSVFALAKRVAGTMVHPNSLGVLAAVAFSFFWSFGPTGKSRAALAVLALLLILLSGSGTGLLCAAAFGTGLVLVRSGRGRVLAGAVSVLACGGLLMALPILTGREDILDSLVLGRLRLLREVVESQGWSQLIFGNGLGFGTNSALSMGMPGALGGQLAAPTDSTFIGLIMQLGIAGTLLFYWMIAWAAIRDRSAAPFFAVVALSSLAINVTEVFPINALLGLALARSTGQGRQWPAGARM